MKYLKNVLNTLRMGTAVRLVKAKRYLARF